MSKKNFGYIKLLTPFLAVILFSSCLSQKKFTYFQPKDSLQTHITLDTLYHPIIHKYDVLSIYVSSISEEASKFFNYDVSGEAGESSGANKYVVDENGEIHLPLVGGLHVDGLTSMQAMSLIKVKLDKYLISPTVKLNISNFRVTVLGEVNKPGVYTVPNEKITLTEALAMAGDLTLYGVRENITIVREVNGKKEFAQVDITARDFFSSSYYSLQGNDIVYIEAMKQKKFLAQSWPRVAPVFLSGLSLIVVLVSLMNP